MTPLHRLPPVWINAALLGSVWASLEIVLGSFLHNLRVPMAGTAMAALGVALLVAGSRMWNMPGLIWRAGAICALMKSVSPSAVILGPMVGIFLEALALEGATRLLGRNAWGYVAGGALAASLPLAQKIAGILVLYGFDAARLYVALVESAARSLQLPGVGPADLILVLFALAVVLGAAAAGIGFAAGSRARRTDHGLPPGKPVEAEPVHGAAHPGQHYSLGLLALHAAAIPAGLMAVSSLPMPLSGALVAAYVGLTLLRYGRVRARLFRFRLLVEFTLVAVLAGFLLGELTGGGPAWSWRGLEAGAQMTLRAALIMTAFAAVSVELRNPVVLEWFLRRGLDSYSMALAVAFEALPAMMQSIGQERLFFRSPLDSVARVLASAREWLKARRGQVFLITGEKGSGKTTLARKVADALARNGVRCSGILSPALLEGGTRTAYAVEEIGTALSVSLCRVARGQGGIRTGRFSFSPEGIAFGTRALERAFRAGEGPVIVDEVGPLELEGGGWSGVLDRFLPDTGQAVLLTVRPPLVEPLCERWQIMPLAVWRAEAATPGEASQIILSHINGSSS
jgi:nucleoside-triphosphatase THEP1